MKPFKGSYSLITTGFESIRILNASDTFASLPIVGTRIRGITETLLVVCGTRKSTQLRW